MQNVILYGHFLHYATYRNHLEIVKFLLIHNADINAKDTFEWSSLHYASEKGHIKNC